MVYAAVLAGGSGLRMGGDLPKQFLCVGGRPIIIRSIDAFIESGSVDKIFAAVGESYVGYTCELIAKYIGENNISVISGGSNRNETLLKVLEEINKIGINDDDIILTHDAVRPFINKRIIDENIAAVRLYGACNTVVPAVDTIQQSDDGRFVNNVPPRSTIFHGQTPQSFNVSELYCLYRTMTADEMENFTDTGSVYVARGKKVFLVQGDRNNIKLTYPEDMAMAEIIIKCKEEM